MSRCLQVTLHIRGNLCRVGLFFVRKIGEKNNEKQLKFDIKQPPPPPKKKKKKKKKKRKKERNKQWATKYPFKSAYPQDSHFFLKTPKIPKFEMLTKKKKNRPCLCIEMAKMSEYPLGVIQVIYMTRSTSEYR